MLTARMTQFGKHLNEKKKIEREKKSMQTKF